MNLRITMPASALITTILSTGMLLAEHYEQADNNSDGYMTSSGRNATVPQAGQTSAGTYYAAGFPFVLPNLPYGHTVTSAGFSAYLTSQSPTAMDVNGDLYADTANMNVSSALPNSGLFFYVGAYDEDPNAGATAIMQHFVTPAAADGTPVETDAAAGTALAAWAQGLLDAGVGPEKYVFLRVNLDAATAALFRYYNFEAYEAYGGHPATLTLDTAFTGDADAGHTRLNLSSGFNLDAWFGVKEFQALKQQGTLTLLQAQTGQADAYVALANGVAAYLQQTTSMLVGGIDNPGAAALGQPVWASHTIGWCVGYAATTVSAGVNPGYVGNLQGTPQDGTFASAVDGRVYHLPSHAGNATYAGDWLEVDTPVAGLDAMDTKANVMAVFAANARATAQASSCTAVLPIEQQVAYSNINFVVAAFNMTHGARNMEIRAVYVDGSEATLHAFPTTAQLHGPVILDATTTDVVPEGVFSAVRTMTRRGAGASAAGGALVESAGTLFEFSTPLALNPAKPLKAIKLVDVNPTLDSSARGLAIFAATATPVPPKPAVTVIVIR